MTIIDLSGTRPNFKRPELLLHEQIPKPLHGLNPRTIKGETWWNEKRKEAYARNNQCCWACGISKAFARERQLLEAHEAYDFDFKKGRAALKEIVALCHYCHSFIHCGRLSNLVAKGMCEPRRFRAVIAHGLAVLEAAGLEPTWYTKHVLDPGSVAPEHSNGVASWESWRMVIDGYEYEPLFKSYAEWAKKYGDG